MEFCLLGDPVLKRKIWISTEGEERKSYQERMPDQWLNELVVYPSERVMLPDIGGIAKEEVLFRYG